MVKKIKKVLGNLKNTAGSVFCSCKKVIKNTPSFLFNCLVITSSIKKVSAKEITLSDIIKETITETVTDTIIKEPVDNLWVKIGGDMYSTLRDSAHNKRIYNSRLVNKKIVDQVTTKKIQNNQEFIQLIQFVIKNSKEKTNTNLNFDLKQDILHKNFVEVINTKNNIKPIKRLGINERDSVTSLNILKPYIFILREVSIPISLFVIVRHLLKIDRIQQLRGGIESEVSETKSTQWIKIQIEKIKRNKVFRYIVKYRLYLLAFCLTGSVCFLARKSIISSIGNLLGTGYNLLDHESKLRSINAEDAINERRKNSIETSGYTELKKKETPKPLKEIKKEKLIEKQNQLKDNLKINNDEKIQIRLEKERLIKQNNEIAKKYGSEKLVSAGLKPQSEVVETYKKTLEQVKEISKHIDYTIAEENTEIIEENNDFMEEDNEIIEL